ncbi:hypothetical protein EHW67_03950 [Arenibacter aquaticus]|uniref:Uncharacterized protein n=1 Tax=Arenibacter aquaticus TaxID=2489054 RepID=A0A3S0CPN1_9FLAO|nr:hypothetical protein [Arenibacter aquaticus]RTE54329.1 hypothetical protein EHW67_03950 [Arenibacter aquaticus]
MNKKSIIKIKGGKVGMIGYGMLTSLESIQDILNSPYHGAIYQVHLEGFQRAWNFACPNNDPILQDDYLEYESFFIKNNQHIPFEKTIFLNIIENKAVQLNCSLFFVSPQELAVFDDFELGYKRIDVTHQISEYQFENGKVYAYKALPTYELNALADIDKCIIDQNYLDLVHSSYDALGIESRKEFDHTTVPPNPKLVAPVVHRKIRR